MSSSGYFPQESVRPFNTLPGFKVQFVLLSGLILSATDGNGRQRWCWLMEHLFVRCTWKRRDPVVFTCGLLHIWWSFECVRQDMHVGFCERDYHETDDNRCQDQLIVLVFSLDLLFDYMSVNMHGCRRHTVQKTAPTCSSRKYRSHNTGVSSVLL